MNLRRTLGTIIGLILSPFILLGLMLSMLFTRWPDMECEARPECDNDCIQCSLYEPKAAYQRRN